MLRGKRQTRRETQGVKDREREKKKINAEMLLQRLSPPNHVILQYRGEADAFLYQVSHSPPGLVGAGAFGGWEGAI